MVPSQKPLPAVSVVFILGKGSGFSMIGVRYDLIDYAYFIYGVIHGTV